MRLICAWCEKEGRPSYLADVEPREDPRETHGICPDHRREVEKRVIALRAEAARQKAEAERREAEAERQRIEAERQRIEAERHEREVEQLREKVDP